MSETINPFEKNPKDRLAALQRRGAQVFAKGFVTPELLRRFSAPVLIAERLLVEANSPLDFGKEVYCPCCVKCTDGEFGPTIRAYPLMPLVADDMMADTGSMLSFTCIHCGFVEHHRVPAMHRVPGGMATSLGALQQSSWPPSSIAQYDELNRAHYEAMKRRNEFVGGTIGNSFNPYPDKSKF